MISIEYKGLQATWSSKSGVWVSSDKGFTILLNLYLPEEDDIDASTPFRIGGIDKVVLDKVKEFLGKALRVVAFFPSPAPAEQEGVVY